MVPVNDKIPGQPAPGNSQDLCVELLQIPRRCGGRYKDEAPMGSPPGTLHGSPCCVPRPGYTFPFALFLFRSPIVGESCPLPSCHLTPGEAAAEAAPATFSTARPGPENGDRETDRPACGLTEHVVPGHGGLLHRLHQLELQDLVVVEVEQQLLTVKRDPAAPLHQVPTGRARPPL